MKTQISKTARIIITGTLLLTFLVGCSAASTETTATDTTTSIESDISSAGAQGQPPDGAPGGGRCIRAGGW